MGIRIPLVPWRPIPFWLVLTDGWDAHTDTATTPGPKLARAGAVCGDRPAFSSPIVRARCSQLLKDDVKRTTVSSVRQLSFSVSSAAIRRLLLVFPPGRADSGPQSDPNSSYLLLQPNTTIEQTIWPETAQTACHGPGRVHVKNEHALSFDLYTFASMSVAVENDEFSTDTSCNEQFPHRALAEMTEKCCYVGVQ
jgi:hypothetical protein